jgi:hypothetical protein
MRITVGLLVLGIAVFTTTAILPAAQHINQVATEQQDNDGIPPWVTADFNNWS